MEDHCVNCNIDTTRCNTIGRRVLDDEGILSIISLWRAPRLVTNEHHVCQACWNKANNVISGRQSIKTPTQVGHSRVCVRCGRSLLGKRQTHLLRTDSTRESAIRNVIREWILPRTLDEADRICHSCWITANKAAIKMRTTPSTSSQGNPRASKQQRKASKHSVNVSSDEESDVTNEQPEYKPSEPVPHEPTIALPGYIRAVETESRCFVHGCHRTERNRVPLDTRKLLLIEYKFYVPQSNRLCNEHLAIVSWDFLDSTRSDYLELFTGRHIVDMLELKDPDV